MYPRSLFRWTSLLLATFVLGCGKTTPLEPEQPNPVQEISGRELPPEIQADARALVEANNRFALDLYAQLRNRSGNLFFSAYSVSTAFAMLSAGAAGQTLEEMASTFRFPIPAEALHPTFGALQRSLDRGSQAGGYQLEIANGAWGQEGFPLLQSFLDITRDDYGAEMQQADFVNASEAARQDINGWVSERTNHKIPELFPGGSINPLTRLVLANAIYFKGLWEDPFDPEHTFDGTFDLSPTETVTVPIMTRFDTCLVSGESDVAMLELPYGGKDLSMLVLLPSRVDGLPELESRLSLELLDRLRQGIVEARIQVDLPRFKFSTKLDLRQLLTQMGMTSAFSADAADFSGIDGRRDLFVSGAFHQGFVEVNEEGTEAAAATGVVVGPTSPPPSFWARHPFLFLIRDNVTGSILFMGRVVDPRS